MPTPDQITQNSTFFEKLLEHRFLFDLSRALVVREPSQFINVLTSEVDAFGFDLVLAVSDRSLHVQMKTRSGRPPSNGYDISEGLWRLPNSKVIWMLYDAKTLEPTFYYLFEFDKHRAIDFPLGRRKGYRCVKMQKADKKRLSIEELSWELFPLSKTSSN